METGKFEDLIIECIELLLSHLDDDKVRNLTFLEKKVVKLNQNLFTEELHSVYMEIINNYIKDIFHSYFAKYIFPSKPDTQQP